MTPLSPAAQAVLDAMAGTYGNYQFTARSRMIAAALLAAVDQVISLLPPPSEHFDVYAQGFRAAHVKYRAELDAMAAELEDTTINQKDF